MQVMFESKIFNTMSPDCLKKGCLYVPVVPAKQNVRKIFVKDISGILSQLFTYLVT